MEAQFVDRVLTCSDCHSEFIFTAGEQLFFADKQFKNDPKRCKPCKGRRSGLTAAANGTGLPAAGLSRTETRTECSECGIETTVPFKPTQGRPVLCRQCFQAKGRAVEPAAPLPSPHMPLQGAITNPSAPETVSLLTDASATTEGTTLSPDAAVLAAALMASASPNSSVASAADLASIAPVSGGSSAEPVEAAGRAEAGRIPGALMAMSSEGMPRELYLAAPDSLDA